MKFKTFTTALIFAIAFTGSAFAERWIHVQVEGDGDEKVSVNLPISLLRSAAALIPDEAHDEIRVGINDLDMDWNDLLTFWEEVKKAPEATYVTIESGDETVKVRKEGDFLVVKTTEAGDDGTQVNVTFPLAVIDALLSGPEGTLNFEGALDALAAYGPGTLITVRDGDETVRVWIDDQNEAE